MGGSRSAVVRLFGFGIAAGAVAPALAQITPPTPPAQGVVPTREELRPPVNAPAPNRPNLVVEGGIERSPCPLAEPSFANIRTNIRTVTLAGLKGVSESQIAPLYRDLMGDDKPVASLCEIRDTVATALRRAGYVAAVQIPTQEINDGEVRLEVLYAKLVAIRVRGNAGRSERLIASYLEPLTRDEVFNQHAAERYLLLANDLPGYDVRLALKPTDVAGEVLGEVTLVRTPVQADFNIQNFAAPETGRFGGQARILFNDLTGMGDQTFLSVYSTAQVREQQVVQAGHEFRVGREGLTFGARASYAWTKPSLPGAPDVLKARTLLATGEARYPLKRTAAMNLWGAAGLDFVNQRVRFASVLIAEDKIRTGFLRFDLAALDTSANPKWQANGTVELRKGLGIFDSSPRFSPLLTRLDGDARAGLIRTQFGGEAKLGKYVSAAVQVRAQYAFDPVLSFEEFAAGNYTVGRGFDPGALLGDSGLGASGELRLSGWSLAQNKVALQPFVFTDLARVWQKGFDASDKLVSVGAGLRASFDNRFRLDLTFALPTTKIGTETKRRDPRLLLSFTTRLWPWGN